MRARASIVALLLGILALAVPEVARAELKLAILNVKGMVCSS